MRRWLVLPTDAWGIATVAVITITAHILVGHPFVRARVQHDRLAATIVERDHAVTAVERRLEELDAAHAEVAERALVIPRLEPASALPDRLDALRAQAGRHAVEVIELRRTGERLGAHANIVALRLVGAATPEACARFLRDMRITEPHIILAALEATPAPAAPPAAGWHVVLDLDWHVAPSAGVVVQVEDERE